MFKTDVIKEIINKRDVVPFPEQFKKLRDAAGVLYYEVDLQNKQNTYVGTADQFVEKFQDVKLSLANAFDESLIKKALENRRNKKTTYFEFLDELAQGGVIAYRVDMKTNAVTYKGKSQEYTEQIPQHLIR